MVKSRRTKIVATVGPSSDSEQRLVELLAAGVDVFRLNLSHGGLESHRNRISRIQAVRDRVGSTAAIMLDTRGPEVRLGTFPGGSIILNVGDHFRLYAKPREGNRSGVSVNWPGLIAASDVGLTMLLDDGNLVMRS
ncbi:MAG: pyruvate kinase [Firmicutes bacterium]|nr:pyruvate kinase [Bacillota bacterium]